MLKKMKKFMMLLCVVALSAGLINLDVLAVNEVSTEISVEITIGGLLPEKTDTFIVELEATESFNPMPEGSSNGIYQLEMEGADSDVIKLSFDKMGKFDYTIKQVVGDNKNCNYDETIYNLTVYVTRNEENGLDLNSVLYVSDISEKLSKVVFDNVYAMPSEVIVNAVKTLDGKVPEDDSFEFQLVDANENIIEKVTNTEGEVVFTPLSFYETGIYRYQLEEVDTGKKNIIYDETIYDVVVEVTKDTDYHATVTYMLDGEEVAAENVCFENETQETVVKTGDNANLTLWLLLAASALVTIIYVVRRRKEY